MRDLLLKLCFVVLLVTLTGCGSGGTSTNGDSGAITAKLEWSQSKSSSSWESPGIHQSTAPSGVVTVRIIIGGTDIANIQKDFPASDGKGVIDGVPAGANRTLTAQGLDASGVVTHQGVKDNITVVPGQTTDVGTVLMEPVAPQTFTVSGKVMLDGVGLRGVAVLFSGSIPPATTASDGAYSFTGIPNGSYTITPSLMGYTFTPANRSVSVDNGDVTGQDFAATVAPPVPSLTSISVTPVNPSVAVGATQQFTASGVYSDGTTHDITTQATWSSLNTSVATVNSSGLATGIAAGNATVAAASGGMTGSTVLTVTSSSLPTGFPSNVPTGNYSIAVQVCAQGTCFSGSSFTMINTDINQFAQSLVDALNASAAQQQASCSQAGVNCSFSITYTPWNGTSFTITDNISVTTANGTASASVIFTVTRIT